MTCSWTRSVRGVMKDTRPLIMRSFYSTEPPDPLSMRSNPSRGDLDKLLGYPTPLLSLRHIMSGRDLSSLSVHLKRLLSSSHPIVEQTKLFIDNRTHTQGMLALLISQCINILVTSSHHTVHETSDQFNILPSQRTIAEVTEMINIAYTIHSGVVNIKYSKENDKELSFGNKMVILGGDILLARACKELSQLYTPKVVGCMSQGISILMSDSFSIPNVHTVKTVNDSLLGRSCQSCAILAQLDNEWEDIVLNLGNYLSIIYQLSIRQPPIHNKNDVLYEACNSALYLLDQLPNCQSKTVLEEFIINYQ